MAEFGFTEAQEMFRATVREFTRRELMPGARERMKLTGFPEDVVKKLAHAGLLSLRVPEKYGGQMADIMTCGIACEETAKSDLAPSYIVLAAFFAPEVLGLFSEEVQDEWMPLVAKAEKRICLGITEPDAGSDAVAIRATAVRDGDHYVLNGEKTAISNGMHADVAVVWVKTNPAAMARGVTAFLVPLDLPGIERLPFDDMGFKTIGRASLTMDNVRIPVKYRLGEEGSGFRAIMGVFDWLKVFLCLQVLALGEQSVYDAIEYAKQRVAFGKPIAKYDAVSFRLVDSLAKIEAAKLLCYKALWLRDQGRSATREAAMAKSLCPTIGIEACNNAMLTFGHVGYSSDYPVEQRLRDVLGYQFADGTADIQRTILVREFIGKEYLNYV